MQYFKGAGIKSKVPDVWLDSDFWAISYAVPHEVMDDSGFEANKFERLGRLRNWGPLSPLSGPGLL